MTTKTPQLRSDQQDVFIKVAKKNGDDPQELLDSLVDHFRAGAEYEEYCRRIEKAKRSIDAGKGDAARTSNGRIGRPNR